MFMISPLAQLLLKCICVDQYVTVCDHNHLAYAREQLLVTISLFQFVRLFLQGLALWSLIQRTW